MADNQDPFADLDYKLSNTQLNKINDVVTRNSNINLASKAPVSKAVQLKAENYDLWFQNERLTEEHAHLSNEHSKLQDKHDKLMNLARNRLGEIRNKYTNLEQDNIALKNELDKLIREYENSKKLIEEYRKLEEKFKISDHDMRIMIDQLTRNNEELKSQNQGLISEVELLREKYFVAKQNLEKTLRESGLLKDDLTKTLFQKDSLDKELVRINSKLTENVAARKAAEDKVEFLNNKVNTTSVDLRKSEANAAMLHERFTLLKAEKDALEVDSRNKIQQMLIKLKDLQTQNKTFLEQLKAQSKQTENLNEENKQLLTYVNGYRSENDILAKQLASVNAKQKRLALELEKLKTADQFQRNEEAIKMNEQLMGVTNELNNLRKSHAHILSENQRIKELLIEKDSVLSNLGYERHQLQDKMIKNQHTIAQLERMLKDNSKPYINGVIPSSGENLSRNYDPLVLPEIN
jgi:DNA repair exonuclease SbcCD ATPase subunit